MALFVNPVSVARTFTTLSGRTVYVMNGLANFDLDALVAACHDKSCAPPPVGTGGSDKGTGSSSVNTEHYAGHLIAAETRFFGEKDQRLSEELWGNYPERPAVRIRIPWTVLRDIHAAEGKILTQHDTGTSQGILDSHLRSRRERQMFGEHEGHPIYGYIGNEEGAAPFSKPESWSRLACYGEIGLELKPEVHARTTVIIGDSLDAQAAPIPMGEIRNASPIRRAVAVQFSSREFEYHPRTVPYIEAQVHGGLSMADVRRIIVPSVDLARHVERMFPDIEVVFDREISSSDPTNFSVCEVHGEFACHDKSCAPPPVGTGGSKPQGALPNGADPDIRARKLLSNEDFPKDEEGVRKNWTRYPSNPVVRIRVPSPLTLKKIIDDGFKSQHETGTSRGFLDPSQRERAEQNMFSAEKTRPVYGYIADAGTETEPGASTSAWVSSYGSIIVELRQSVHDRTTVTMGDSLFDAVSGNIAPLRMSDVKDASIERKGVATATPSKFRATEHYVETQVHGPITAADIKRVYVKPLDVDSVKEVLKDYPDIEVVEISDIDIYGLGTVTIGFMHGQLVASCDLHGEFACHDKSCAPPPVGTGGSKPDTGSSARSSSGYRSARKAVTQQQLIDRDWRSIADAFGGEVSQMMHQIVDDLETLPTSDDDVIEWSDRVYNNSVSLTLMTQKPDLERGGLQFLNDMWEVNGFRRSMTLVSSEELDAMEDSAAHKMMFRGVRTAYGADSENNIPAEQIQNDLLRGEYWQGNGWYGQGTYFAMSAGDESPMSYAYVLDDARSYGNQMIRSRLVDGAKVIAHDDLRSLMTQTRDSSQYVSRVSMPLLDRISSLPLDDTRKHNVQSMIEYVMNSLDHTILQGNVSTVATLLGFDAIQTDTPGGRMRYVVTLNRSALISDGMNVRSSRMAEHMLGFARKKVSNSGASASSTGSDTWESASETIDSLMDTYRQREQASGSLTSSGALDNERPLLSQRAGTGMAFHDWGQYADPLAEQDRFFKSVEASDSFEGLPEFAKEIILSGEKVWQGR